jgi:hypothetical protein
MNSFEFLQKPIRLRRGTTFVPGGAIIRVIDRHHSAYAFCHLHEPSRLWIHDPNLTGKYIVVDRFAGLEVSGTNLLIVTEDSVLAMETK